MSATYYFTREQGSESASTTAILPTDLLRLIAASGRVPRIVDPADLKREPAGRTG
jgi:hypothetical protein